MRQSLMNQGGEVSGARWMAGVPPSQSLIPESLRSPLVGPLEDCTLRHSDPLNQLVGQTEPSCSHSGQT